MVKLNPTQSTLFKTVFAQDKEGNLKMKNSKYGHIGCFAGYRSGKSYIMGLIVFLLASTYPKSSIGIIRNSYQQLHDSSIKQFLETYPPEKSGYKYKKTPRDCIFNNGSRISFRAYDVDPDKIKSSEYDCLLLVQAEQISEELFLACIGRLSSTAMPRTLLLTEGNPARCHLRDLYITSTKEWRDKQGIYFIKGSTFENAHNLDPNYIKNLKANYPPSYLKRYLYGSWDSVDDQVYTSLATHHVIKPVKIQDHWFKCVGLDHGTINDSSIVFIAKSDTGEMYVFDEWQGKQASIETLATQCTKYGRLPVIADFSMKAHMVNASSVWSDLYETGLNLIECQKRDKQANILLVNKAFHTNKLYFFDHCKYSIKQHQIYHYKEQVGKEDRKEQVVKKDDHSCDAVQYCVRYLDTIEVKSSLRFQAPLSRGRPTMHEIIESGGYYIGG